jgi:hypothetical protein
MTLGVTPLERVGVSQMTVFGLSQSVVATVNLEQWLD